MTGINIFRWWSLKTSIGTWNAWATCPVSRGGWLVISTLRKFRSANGINRSSSAWNSCGWQRYEIRKQIDFEFFYFDVSKTKTSKLQYKHWSYMSPRWTSLPCWLVDWYRFNAGTTYIEGPQMRRRRAWAACHHACIILYSASRTPVPWWTCGKCEVHTSSTPISNMPESGGPKGQGGQGPINGKQQLEHNRDRMARMSSKLGFFVEEKLRGIGDMLFWPAWLLLFGMKMTSVKRYEDLEALGGQIIEGDECAAMVFV